MGEMMTREQVNRSLGRGVVGVGTGLGLLILGGPMASWTFLIPGLAPIPVVIGGIIAMAGWNTLKKQEGSLGGLLALGAGALTLVSGLPLIGGLGGFFLGVGAVGSLIYGGLQLWRFFKGVKSRGS